MVLNTKKPRPILNEFIPISGEFRIPAGVYGEQLSGTGKCDLGVPMIQWEVTYNGWELLKGEIQELLHQIARGAGGLVGLFCWLSWFAGLPADLKSQGNYIFFQGQGIVREFWKLVSEK